MQKNYTLIFLLVVLSLSSCLKKDEIEILPEKAKEPVLKGAIKVDIIVDEAYDLSRTQAHSVMDSASMGGNTNGLYVPKDFESAAFFIDENSGEILALVLTDPVSDNLIVNAESVAEALLTVVPAYNSLTLEMKENFEKEALTIKPYKEFVQTVDALLKNNQPIYSTDPNFINQILELNRYILKNYLGDPNFEGGRVQSGGKDKFANWLTSESDGTLNNLVHSYVYAEFTPSNGGEAVTTILDPKPLAKASKTSLSKLGLKDDCYTVSLNQTHPSVVDKNFYELSTRFAKMFLTAILGRMGSDSRNDCIAAIVGSIQIDINAAVLELGKGGANLSPIELLSKFSAIAGNTIQTAFTNDACQRTVLNKKVIAKALAAQSNLFLKVVEGAALAYELAEYIPFVVAQTDPVNLSENMQLHDGKLKEACVEVVKDGELNAEYSLGETIYPGLKLVPQSQYADWKKAGFEVEWKLDPGNGSLNLLNTSTSNEGKATVAWTLPTDINEARLHAEIKDKEGDHLKGSPITFNVTLKDSLEIYRLAAIGSWTVTNAEYPDNPARDLELFGDGTGKYVGEGGGPFNGGAQYPITWSIMENNGRYYLYEGGFWHPGYNQFREIGTGLPNEYLSYPLTFMKTYNDLGEGPIEALTYTKK